MAGAGVSQCEISGNNISDIGDSGVAIMGSMLRSTGLGARQFPLNVSVSANTIRDIGRFGKQVTGEAGKSAPLIAD